MSSSTPFSNLLRQLTEYFDRLLNLKEDVSNEMMLLRQHCESAVAEERQRALLDKKTTVRSCGFSKLPAFPIRLL